MLFRSSIEAMSLGAIAISYMSPELLQKHEEMYGSTQKIPVENVHFEDLHKALAGFIDMGKEKLIEEAKKRHAQFLLLYDPQIIANEYDTIYESLLD